MIASGSVVACEDRRVDGPARMQKIAPDSSFLELNSCRTCQLVERRLGWPIRNIASFHPMSQPSSDVNDAAAALLEHVWDYSLHSQEWRSAIYGEDSIPGLGVDVEE